MSWYTNITSKIKGAHKYLEDEVYYKTVDKYVSTGIEYPELHWAEMLAVGAVVGGQKVGQNTLVKAINGNKDLLAVAMTTEISPKVARVMNDVAQTLADPNIEGIPIRTSKLGSSRDVEVGECLVIVQSANNKEYTTDNAAPKLREWQLEGVLTPLSTWTLLNYLVGLYGLRTICVFFIRLTLHVFNTNGRLTLPTVFE